MLYGSNEWSQSTLRQVDRMSELIKVFVTLAKSEERYGEGSFSAVNLSTLAEDTCNTFASVAEQAGKTLTGDITPDITVNGDSGTLQALITILVDNAVKYCDEGGDIRVAVLLRGKNAVLQVSNRYAEGKDIDYSRFFERFYRADTSHNIEKGGYGIGLSIAQNIAEHHKGKLTVSWKDGDITFEFVLKALLFLP